MNLAQYFELVVGMMDADGDLELTMPYEGQPEFVTVSKHYLDRLSAEIIRLQMEGR